MKFLWVKRIHTASLKRADEEVLIPISKIEEICIYEKDGEFLVLVCIDMDDCYHTHNKFKTYEEAYKHLEYLYERVNRRAAK